MMKRETVQRITDHDPAQGPFFIYSATPAQRYEGIATDEQLTRTFDLMYDKIEACDNMLPDAATGHYEAGQAMHALKDLAQASGQNWATVKAEIEAQWCNDRRKQERFRTLAFASSADDLLNASVTALHETGQWDKTLVVFTADNGGWYGGSMFNHPLKGGKNTYYEGGHRMHTGLGGGYLPSVLHGMVSNVLSSNCDWWPTFAWLAGLDPYYDPREDDQDFGARGYGPKPVDGLVLVHSWNRMAEGGQAKDEYVNGIRRFLYHYGQTQLQSELPPESVFHYADRENLRKNYANDDTPGANAWIPYTSISPGECSDVLGAANFWDPQYGSANMGCTTADILNRKYPCPLHDCGSTATRRRRTAPHSRAPTWPSCTSTCRTRTFSCRRTPTACRARRSKSTCWAPRPATPTSLPTAWAT